MFFSVQSRGADHLTMERKPIWLDADPGHDDAIALLLATNLPQVRLLGVSTVHGNASAECTKLNAMRLLHAFGAHDAESAEIDVWPGATKPLIRPTRADPEIHGEDGLAGVEGLCGPDDPAIKTRLERSAHLKAIEGIAKAIRDHWKDGGKNGQKVTICTCGPLTNLALFASVYPELIPGIEEIVFMGGGIGLGNRSAVAEFNILCDPEAAQIVLDIPVRKVMIPLNVTHTALLTKAYHARLLEPSLEPSSVLGDVPLPPASSPLRHTLSTLLSFFAESYRTAFGFENGPPLHDALTVAYVAAPHLFTSRRYRVDVELGVSHAMGETIADLYNYKVCDDSWGMHGKNCIVAQSVDVAAFFELFFTAIELSEGKQKAEST